MGNTYWLKKGALLAVVALCVATVFVPAPSALVAVAAAIAVIASTLFVSGRLFITAEPLGAEHGGQYLDLPAENAGLKEMYDDQKVESLAYKKNVFLAMVPKNAKATGKVVPIPIIYEVSQGRSGNFANAQNNQTPMLLAEAMLTLRPDYSIATIGHQAALAAMDDKGGFVDFAKEFMDVAVQSAALSAGSALFRSGTGSRGAISTITAGVIVLTNPADVSQFGIGQTLQANSTDGGSPRAALGYVIARSVRGGSITVSAAAQQGAAGTPTGWAAADFLLVQGDNNSMMSGQAAWLPSTDPATTDNFYGMNRSPDTRLYGLFYNGISQSIEEALIDASLLQAREGGDPSHFFTNFGSMSALIKAMGTRREYVDWKSEDGVVGFRGVKVQGPNGIIEAYVDRNCQSATGFLNQLDTWKLYSLNAVPHIFNWGDGLEVLRLANGDAYEGRSGYFANLGCRAPGWNSQLALQV